MSLSQLLWDFCTSINPPASQTPPPTHPDAPCLHPDHALRRPALRSVTKAPTPTLQLPAASSITSAQGRPAPPTLREHAVLHYPPQGHHLELPAPAPFRRLHPPCSSTAQPLRALPPTTMSQALQAAGHAARGPPDSSTSTQYQAPEPAHRSRSPGTGSNRRGSRQAQSQSNSPADVKPAVPASSQPPTIRVRSLMRPQRRS